MNRRGVRGLRQGMAAIGLTAIIAASMGQAAQAQSGRSYSACNDDGELFVVTVGGQPPSGCGSPIVRWREVPQQGARGPAGRRGPEGRDGRRGRRGPRGDEGVVGPVGPQGPRGPQGPSGGVPLYALTSDAVSGGSGPGDATCDAGDAVVSGGFIASGAVLASLVLEGDVPTGWSAPALAETDGDAEAKSYLLCMDLPPRRG